jgi:hypothetical protein
VAPHGGRRKWGPVPHALERGDGLGAGAGNGWSQRRRATVGKTREGARWWGSGVARGPAR